MKPWILWLLPFCLLLISPAMAERLERLLDQRERVEAESVESKDDAAEPTPVGQIADPVAQVVS